MDVAAIRARHISARKDGLKHRKCLGSDILFVDAGQAIQAGLSAVVCHCITHYRRETRAIMPNSA